MPLFLDAHTKRAFEATSRVDHFLGKLAPDNPLLRRVPAFEDCGTLTAASASTGAINLLGGKMRRVRAVCLPASEGWDLEFESGLLQRRVRCEPDFLDQSP